KRHITEKEVACTKRPITRTGSESIDCRRRLRGCCLRRGSDAPFTGAASAPRMAKGASMYRHWSPIAWTGPSTSPPTPLESGRSRAIHARRTQRAYWPRSSVISGDYWTPSQSTRSNLRRPGFGIGGSRSSPTDDVCLRLVRTPASRCWLKRWARHSEAGPSLCADNVGPCHIVCPRSRSISGRPADVLLQLQGQPMGRLLGGMANRADVGDQLVDGA